MNLCCNRAALAILLSVCSQTFCLAAPVETVRIGNPGNAPDADLGFGAFGDVPRVYRIGTFEVTNQQYTEFLNAVASSDVFGLYNEEMGQNDRGGISRELSGIGFVYSTRANMANKPVNFVSLWDAARFANWLHNGMPRGPQDSSTTEDGAYLLPDSASPESVLVRKTDALWFLPSESEWYKAAYHQPASEGGDDDGYWFHSRGSNLAPNAARADEVGNIVNGERRGVANYNLSADWGGVDGNVTTVGSGGPRSSSFYGTFDQAGNVDEWTEGFLKDEFGRFQVLRGGNFATPAAGNLGAGFRGLADPAAEAAALGFRVATVPEPSGCMLFLIASLPLVVRLSRKSKDSAELAGLQRSACVNDAFTLICFRLRNDAARMLINQGSARLVPLNVSRRKAAVVAIAPTT